VQPRLAYLRPQARAKRILRSQCAQQTSPAKLTGRIDDEEEEEDDDDKEQEDEAAWTKTSMEHRGSSSLEHRGTRAPFTRSRYRWSCFLAGSAADTPARSPDTPARNTRRW